MHATPKTQKSMACMIATATPNCGLVALFCMDVAFAVVFVAFVRFEAAYAKTSTPRISAKQGVKSRVRGMSGTIRDLKRRDKL